MKSIEKPKIGREIFRIFLWLYCIFSIYPLVWMTFNSLKNNDEIFVLNPFGFPANFRVENYLEAVKNFNLLTYFFNSLFVAFFTILGTLLLSLTFSYAVARMKWKFQGASRIYMTMGMFIPIQVILIPLAILVKNFQMTNTYLSLIVPYIAFNLSFSFNIFYGFLRGIPLEMEESACIDGASIYRTFASIILPIVKPAIATMIIFLFLSSWNEFTIACILISKEALKTLPLGLLFFQGQFTTNWGAMAACMTIASIPTVLIYLLFSEQVEKALTVSAALKG